MMQPKTVNLYVPEIDEVARDFIEITRKYRNSNNETPADYGTCIYQFALESISTVALEARLNIMEPKRENKGKELVALVRKIFYLSYELDFRPSIWKYIRTPMFNDMTETANRMTT